MDLPGRRRTDVVLALLAIGVAATWALLTPPLRAPDEPQHLNSVLRIAYGGGWPRPGEAVLSPAVQRARVDVALATDVPGRWQDRPGVPQLSDAQIVPRAERARVSRATALPDRPATEPGDVDQMTQHPPLYYALGAGLLHVTGLADARWDQQLLALRLLDVALLAPLVPLASWSARRLTGSRAAGAVAALVPLLSPQVGHIFGAVSNDTLVTLVAGVVTALAVRVLTGDRRLRTATLIGAVIGVGLLTKVMAAFLLPVVALAYVLSPAGALGAGTTRRWRGLGGDAVRVLLMGGVAACVGGWWWVRNLVLYGAVQPVGLDRVPLDLLPHGFGRYLMIAWRSVALSFFGDFGWLDLRTPETFWLTATVLVLVLGAFALSVRGSRRAVATLLALPTLLLVAVIGNAWGYYREHGQLVGVQGRYLFAGLVALAVVVAVAVHRVCGAGARTWWAVPGVLALAVAVNAYGARLGFTGFYRAPGWSFAQAWQRWELLAPVGPVWLWLVPALTAVVALVALVITARQASEARRAALRGALAVPHWRPARPLRRPATEGTEDRQP
ncbi:MAG: DUF2142 domain-containing protein [Promicromonosporaceae bacterium]|nr:DUF2142 domain-containing protein [Promicromonosporaceae bacterium]